MYLCVVLCCADVELFFVVFVFKNTTLLISHLYNIFFPTFRCGIFQKANLKLSYNVITK